MIIVGELINATRKAVREAIEAKDVKTIQKLAKDQAEAGASYIDVNAGVFVESEAEYLQWIIDSVSEVTEVPCCIDSSSPKTIETTLASLKEKSGATPMINSISLEKKRFDSMIPVIAGTDLKVIALCMDDGGMPETADQRLRIADNLINALVRNNIKLENIYVDPLVQALATNSIFGIEFLKAVDGIMTGYPGVHTMCGLSNISFGMPARKFMNQNLMVMAIAHGLDGAIMNPLDKTMMACIVTAEALAGKDKYSMNYLKAYRGQMFENC